MHTLVTLKYRETREEIERLLKEDPTLYERGGTASAAQTGEEYRQTLRCGAPGRSATTDGVKSALEQLARGSDLAGHLKRLLPSSALGFPPFLDEGQNLCRNYSLTTQSTGVTAPRKPAPVLNR